MSNYEYQIKLSSEDAHVADELAGLLTHCGVSAKITIGDYTEVETTGLPVGLMLEQWLALRLRKQK